MLSLRSIRLLNSPSLFTTSIYRTKPLLSTFFLRGLTSKTSPSSLDDVAKGVVRLQCKSSAPGGICHVYLVGTCHFSQKSCEDVKAVINYLKPEVVFLELCLLRVKTLTADDKDSEVPRTSQMIDMSKTQNVNIFGVLYRFQAKIASELGRCHGAEFKVAYQEATSCGARVILGDRPILITLMRLLKGTTMWQKFKSFCQFFWDTARQNEFEEFEENDTLADMINKMMRKMEDRDVLDELIQEMSIHFPSLMEVLVVERDKYMSDRLWAVARKHSSVVAVVGRGHLSGIEKNWMQPIEIQSLLEVPLPKKGFNMFKTFSSVKALASAVIASASNLWSKK